MPFPCHSCASLSINGIPCHETGCPDAWRDYAIPCRECGCDFLPEERYQRVCLDCIHAMDESGALPGHFPRRHMDESEVEEQGEPDGDPFLIASQWWSVNTWSDPGVCMYAFGSTGRVQSEEHRADLLRYIANHCFPHCEQQDNPERCREELETLREYIESAEIEVMP